MLQLLKYKDLLLFADHCKLKILGFWMLVRQNKQFEDVTLGNYDGHFFIIFQMLCK